MITALIGLAAGLTVAWCTWPLLELYCDTRPVETQRTRPSKNGRHR